jgi:(5-formylfuran-3-yl)methyl phosphate synthase
MNRPGLLVSVRSAEEARAALAGGADLIDVKEPSRGPLGRADDQTIREILDEVGGRAPVSAAFGEWRDYLGGPIPDQLRFVKWGLAGCRADWTSAVDQISNWVPARSVSDGRLPRDRGHPARPGAGDVGGPVGADSASAGRMPAVPGKGHHPVLVAYADHELADSPPPGDLVEAACRHRFPVFLIDTATKDGRTLLDWLAESTLVSICDRLRAGGVRIALAGSLDVRTIRRLSELRPDWFAVRGAACVGGREGAICSDRVRELRAVISREG